MVRSIPNLVSVLRYLVKNILIFSLLTGAIISCHPEHSYTDQRTHLLDTHTLGKLILFSAYLLNVYFFWALETTKEKCDTHLMPQETLFHLGDLHQCGLEWNVPIVF